MKVIARIHNDFTTKFGIPRQSGLVDSILSEVVFEPEYRNPEALRGIEGFSHLWLIWEFSEAIREKWSPTVRPPRLGGNKRMGGFATRSPFRPNNLGLSSVKLINIRHDNVLGDVLVVGGADLMNGTPIYDIKPYLTTTDCHPEAKGGFVAQNPQHFLDVNISDEMTKKLPPEKVKTLIDIIAQDPRPAYQCDNERTYGFLFGESQIKFKVTNDTAEIKSIEKIKKR